MSPVSWPGLHIKYAIEAQIFIKNKKADSFQIPELLVFFFEK